MVTAGELGREDFAACEWTARATASDGRSLEFSSGAVLDPYDFTWIASIRTARASKISAISVA
jgi:hypothetical protein